LTRSRRRRRRRRRKKEREHRIKTNNKGGEGLFCSNSTNRKTINSSQFSFTMGLLFRSSSAVALGNM